MRYRTATRVALNGLFVSGIVGAGLFACNDVIKDTPVEMGQGPIGGGGNDGGGSVSGCKTSCCPTEEKCYVSGKEGPGSECLATRDNTGQTKIQIRQTWVYPTTPAGLKTDVIYSALNGSTAWPACQTPTGLAGYIRVMETDTETDISRVGWARYVPPEQGDDAIQNGLCMMKAATGWIDTTRAIPQGDIYVADYPPGLPQPLAMPFAIRPTQARRVMEDFQLDRNGTGGPISELNRGELTDAGQAKRRELLAKTLEDQNKADGIDGFYYMDEAAGTVHGFATVAFQVIYNLGQFGKSYIVVPIHEPETYQKYTNPQQRNCVGVYRAGQVQVPDCTAANTNGGNPTNPDLASWSGVDTSKLGVGDAWTKGYFLTVELEQIWVELLKNTLCYQYPGAGANLSEWATTENKSCRATGKWNSKDPVNGMPPGDWCSKTNGPATPDCHDAYLTVAYHAFAGAKIKEGTCDP